MPFKIPGFWSLIGGFFFGSRSVIGGIVLACSQPWGLVGVTLTRFVFLFYTRRIVQFSTTFGNDKNRNRDLEDREPNKKP